MSHRLRSLALRVFAAVFRRRSTPGLDDELQFHIDMAVESYLRQGLASEEARRRALAGFGGLQQIREHYRDQKGIPMLETTLQDLRYGLRVLAANRTFTAMAVLSLALGIGANTAIFSLLYALLLRPLPVPNPGELVQVKITIAGTPSDSFSYPVIEALAERKDVFAALGGFAGNLFTAGPPSAPVRTPGAWVSGGFFQALQLTPAAGRLLMPEDDRPGAGLVAVISDGYWDRRFQRSPNAAGSTLLVEGLPVTIVGVTPPGFTGANVGEIVDLTLPYQFLSHLSADRQGLLQAGNQFSRILARPARGLSIAQARARLKVIWPAMAQISVSSRTPQKRREAMLASTLDLSAGGGGWTPLRSQYSKPLTVLMAISAVVLLLACTNVANLLLARSAARRREFAIRLAIGAGRARVIRQLLVESLQLSFLGAALGLVLAHYGSRLLLTQVSPTLHLDVGLNLPVLEFAVAAAVLTGLLFGIAPALRSTSADGATALRTASSAGQARGRLAGSLVTVQVALSFLLLTGAGLFVRTLHNLESVDPGFRDEGVLMADLDGRRIVHAGPESGPRIAALFRDTLDAVTAVHGVTAAALSNFTPISGGYWSQAVQGRAHIHSEYALLANVVVAAEDATFQDVGHFAAGVVPGDGIFTAWSYRAGAGRAEAFLLNPQPLPARTAYEWGVVAEVVPNGKALSRARELAALYLKAPEVTRRDTRIHFIQPLKERIVREVGYGLSVEGASAADLVKSMQAKTEAAAPQEDLHNIPAERFYELRRIVPVGQTLVCGGLQSATRMAGPKPRAG